MAGLMAMEHYLELLVQSNRHNVMIEAYSELIINLVKKISWETKLEKASRNWRLIQVFQWIHNHLQSLRTFSFKHVRIKATKLADLLANQGVISKENRVTISWLELHQNRLKENFHDQADDDRLVFQYKAIEAGFR